MRLEEIREGQRVEGLSHAGPAVVEKVALVGSDAVRVLYRDPSGALREVVLYRDDEKDISECDPACPRFGADANDLKLASEAYRIGLAYLFDPYLAVHTSAIEPLPHQITAVYQEMLPKLPLRYVLADDPGAGKTIMAGLLVKEMMARGDLKRCLIVCPGSLCEQWQDELYEKFGLRFTIVTKDLLESSVTRNAFAEHDLCIARLDKLARDEAVRGMLERSAWDLVVCDEAHKMSAHAQGRRVSYTKRYRLGELLGSRTENLLLMTATPHNGKPDDFQLFMALVDPDRFGITHGVASNTYVSDVMRRLVKEELLKFDGRPLFPERRAYTVEYSLSPAEKDLYECVTRYVREEFNRADRLDGRRRTSVGFALTTLQRRLASSPEAIYQSLRRRRLKLESQLEQARRATGPDPAVEYDGDPRYLRQLSDDFDEDDYAAEDLERLQDEFVDGASAAASVEELEAEISTLADLEAKARSLRDSGTDRKWEELSALLQDDAHMFSGDGAREKLIIFTEHKDTLGYLAQRVASLLGDPGAVVTIRGGMRRDARREVQRRFTQDRGVRVLIATDAAGEGINLQRAHLMINYDLPWNPNRLEQRFGRIHRIGQTEVCHLWNLVSADTREGQVFQRLFDKLNEEREALGGKVFDVLGRVSFGERSLSDLLLEAVRYGEDPAVRARLDEVVDSSLDADALRHLVAEYSLTDDLLSVQDVRAVKEDMERAAAHKLAPHFIASFFLAAMRRFEGRVSRREPGRYEVRRVPGAVLEEARRQGLDGVGKRYERITFEKDRVNVPGSPVAELIVPGHPLLEALRLTVTGRLGPSMDEGAVLVDETDWGEKVRLLVYVECAIEDDPFASASRVGSVASRSLRFVELTEDLEVRSAGYAPYLDYRAPSQEELELVGSCLEKGAWLGVNADEAALDYALSQIVPEELTRVRRQRNARIDKVSRAVDERLTAEVRYWDERAAELSELERRGKPNAQLNADNAAARAEELSLRRTRRLERLESARHLHAVPPRITGRALVVPQGLLARLKGEYVDPAQLSERARIEAAGMRSVMRIERELGNEPEDVSKRNEGYDVVSRVGEGSSPNRLRLIEVKGRAAGAGSVTVSHNEVLAARSKEDDAPGSFLLAIVEVDGAVTRTTYIAHPFTADPDPAMDATTYSIRRLREQGEVVLEREITW